MPIPALLAIVFAVGTLIGSFINLAIYRLAWEKKCYSPWGPKHPDASARKPLDFVPLFGWLSLKREEKLFGVAYWTRPFAIELAFAAGLTGFYFFQFEGGLLGDLPKAAAANQQYWAWFLLHGFLLVLLTTATFIDFDEKTIPDRITVTGTLFALAFAATFPLSRLPISSPLPPGWQALHFNSPQTLPAGWLAASASLWIAVACFVFWCAALLPYPHRIKFGKFGTVKYFFAIMFRPKRKTDKSSVKRAAAPIMYLSPLIALLGVPLICYVYFGLPATHWESLICSVLGMTFGLTFVWLIRLVAGTALGTEAMGFGDVTLMAMIGAFLGWQAALLTFALAPFAAVLIAIVQFVTTKKPKIAFGPYLSLAAVFIVIAWWTIWHEWAQNNVFVIGAQNILMVIGGSLVLMYLMLTGWGAFKNRGTK